MVKGGECAHQGTGEAMCAAHLASAGLRASPGLLLPPRFPNATPDDLAHKLHSSLGSSVRFSRPKKGGADAFTLAHYAGPVRGAVRGIHMKYTSCCPIP